MKWIRQHRDAIVLILLTGAAGGHGLVGTEVVRTGDATGERLAQVEASLERIETAQQAAEAGRVQLEDRVAALEQRRRR